MINNMIRRYNLSGGKLSTTRHEGVSLKSQPE
jgi:hypothetical protein